MKRILFLIFLTAGPAWGGVIVSDQFTVGMATNLASHTPTTTGTSWVEDQDTCASNYQASGADYAEPVADAANCIMMYSPRPNPSLSRYDVQSSFIDAGSVLATDCMGISARWTDASNYYSLGVCDDAGNAYRLYKRVADVSTSLGSGGSFANTNTDVIVMQMIGASTKRIYENGTLIISNSDSDLTGPGQAGIWCGQVQVAGDDCDTNGLRLDNFSITEYSAKVVDLDFWVREAHADDVVHTGRWYISPVVKNNGVREPKLAGNDPSCAWSAVIGNFDTDDEWSLVYTACRDYGRMDRDASLTMVYEGDIDIGVKDLSDKKRQRMEAVIRQRNPQARLNPSRPVSEWLDQLGRMIKPEFHSQDVYVQSDIGDFDQGK